MVPVLYRVVAPACGTVDFSGHLPLRAAGRYVLSPVYSVCDELYPQLIRDLGITNGKESQVGYYVGLMVR